MSRLWRWLVGEPCRVCRRRVRTPNVLAHYRLCRWVGGVHG